MKRFLAFSTVFTLLFAATSAISTAAPPPATPSFDQAVDDLFAQAYPQSVVNTLNSFGDSPLGFRMGGSPAERAGADYLASEFTSMGFTNVRKEPVPLDAWTLRGASVQVGDRVITASQFPGVPGTNGPLTAPIVYVGQGRAADYAGKDVTGKLVLVDIEFDDYWFHLTGAEAKLRGAVGIVFTNGANTAPYHSNPNGLASDESRWGLDFPPAVFISTNDGSWLKNRLNSGPVSPVVTSDVDIKMHNFANPSSGGIGYNVVAEIPGTDPGAKAILISAHHDAYFRAGLDDTGAVAQVMTIAKAMKMSGTQLRRPVIFLLTSGEEFGYADTQYDYLAGAWYAATVAHTSTATDPAQRWTGPQGRLALLINIEESPQQGAPLYSTATPDLVPWFSSVAETWDRDLLPHGHYPFQPFTLWQDGATWAFSGVPTVVTAAEKTSYEGYNHTTDDDASLIDYSYMNKLVKFYNRVTISASTGLLPHDLDAQAADLTSSISGPQLKAAGGNPQTVDALVTAALQYKSATAAYSARKASIPSKRWASVNDGLSALQSFWYRNLSGMDAGDNNLIYPFQQTQRDIEHMKAAVTHLQANPVEKDAAIEDLKAVGITSSGLEFSPSVYADELKRYLPDYYLLNWGAQTNQFWHVDITDKVRQIRAGNYSAAIAGLQGVVAQTVAGVNVTGSRTSSVHIDGLNERMADVTNALNTMTPMVNNLK
jgi:aminopeptidase YwaD